MMPFKTLSLAAALAAATGFVPAQASTCLHVSEIDRTEARDARTLVFHMKDGTVWANTLKTPCSELRYSGFTHTVNNGRICENVQTIQPLLAPGTCTLGTFTQVN